MSAPQITPLPLAPSPSDPGDVFDAKAFALTSAWPDFINETNAAANYIEGGVDAVADSIAGATDTAINAAQSAASAASASQVAQYASEASSATAVGAANFKGSWAGLSGPLGLPSSVEHDGYFWVLLESVSDVTAHEPGAGGKWQIISSPTIRERLLKEATLNLDFANNKYEVYEGPVSGMTAKPFNDILNFTRSSGATAKTATGGITDVLTGEQRLVGNREGLLIEGQRTRLNTIAAAPTAPENVTVAAAAHTISFYGTGSVGLTGVATDTLVGTGANDRVTLTFTPTAGTLTLAPSGTVADLQLEVGRNASSVIRGEGTQVTRAADKCSRALGAEFNQQEGTFLLEFTPAGEFEPSYILTDGASRRVFYTLSSTALVAYDGSTTVSINGLTLLTSNKAALSFSKSGAQMALNGAANAKNNGFSFSAFSALDFFISRSGTISAFQYFPRALTEAEIIDLTTPGA